MKHKATIIGVSDATHYLVGMTDQNDNFTALPTLNEIAICPSLYAAKQLLKQHNVYSAQLTLHSPYDEMCGLPSSSVSHETIKLR